MGEKDANSESGRKYSSIVDFVACNFDGIGSTKALERYGIYLISNNWRKMHHLPKRRK